MSIQLKGSETEKNLLKAFAGESQARNRYTYFASRARKEGLMQISAIFEETAANEKEHAERFFKYLEGGQVTISAEFPAGFLSNTAANLAEAAAGEYDEWHNLYPSFAAIARAEGFLEIAKTWDAVCVSEKQHEKRYRALLANLENETVFCRKDPVVWKCRNCGYIHTAAAAPEVCPACVHSKAYFELLAENW
ncbi:MAG: rubrerythrin family protein [Lentisphaeria bacterium]|nr:rubrerythrin family protein [Lentisphaeria bacterium]